ncbi:MAG: RNB domain-containing ribonuclease [Candidatus Micrarchaeota archaeon]|nr:RNB domain-containing ribonuclease [Candidatus Micrarchaeota archaeon]
MRRDRRNPRAARQGQAPRQENRRQMQRKPGRLGKNTGLENIDLRQIARAAMQKYGFVAGFPQQVEREVNSLQSRVDMREGKGMQDMRGVLWSSIDNYDTEDLDQIEYCEAGAGGEIHVKVGVADVDAYVPKGSAADRHALGNTTSVYTGIETFPMLPDRLSKGMSSLPEGQDRLAVVAEFAVLPNGVVRPGGICRAIVRNKAKLVYEQVAAWLDNTGPIPKRIAEVEGMEEQIFLQDKAAQRLGKHRMMMGALELESMEARAVIKDDKVLGLSIVEENRAMHIIENFMIGANGVMSGFLEQRNVPSIHRVVREPKDWVGIRLLAKAKGFSLPAKPSAKALSEFLAERKGIDPETFPDLSLAIVKMIGAGEYVLHDKETPIGHFCLAVTHYTHGTAPNRRYVDLIIQRLIKTSLAGQRSPYGRNELSEAAGWCTDREMAAKRVERFMVKSEAATLLSGKVGETFDAIVTGASEKGVYARLLNPPVEGRMVSSVRGARVGQKIRVRLVNLDPRQGFVDFEMAR